MAACAPSSLPKKIPRCFLFKSENFIIGGLSITMLTVHYRRQHRENTGHIESPAGPRLSPPGTGHDPDAERILQQRAVTRRRRDSSRHAFATIYARSGQIIPREHVFLFQIIIGSLVPAEICSPRCDVRRTNPQAAGFRREDTVEETLATLGDLVREGKIRDVGVSNFSGWHVMKSLAAAKQYGYPHYVVNQTYYSLIGRDYE